MVGGLLAKASGQNSLFVRLQHPDGTREMVLAS
jgi:hypothetical protein